MCMVCPWWAGYLIDNPIRRLIHNPEQLVGEYVRPGMTVLDIGCGMGFLAIPMAKMLGGSGIVIAVDVQQRMLDALMQRARRAGVADRIQPYRARPDDIGSHGPVHFATAFFSIHEAPDTLRILRQIRENLRPEARFYIAEPIVEVSEAAFETTLAIAQTAGFTMLRRLQIKIGRAALLAPVQ